VKQRTRHIVHSSGMFVGSWILFYTA
jgi:hypothetical protein